ncbi:MAG TPA: S41 family peptidase [Kofleriaceae bacterium]|nr:S41 family peptidase [Kofleriaceae bacterium]
MIRTSHIGAFLAGTVVACAVGAVAAPSDPRTRFTRLDAFARALHLTQTEYVDDVDEAALINNAIAGMTHGLDRYSTYLSPQRYHRMIEDTEGEYASVGLTIGPGAIDDAHPNLPPYPWIDDVAAGSPAEAAGVLPDDRLVAVNGNPTTIGGKAGKETADASQWEAQLRGEPGTRVKLLVLRAGSKEPRELSLVRARMKVPSVHAEPIGEGIGYIAISRFAETTAADTTVAIANLQSQQAYRALILDLRRNPGGLVTSAIAVADTFLHEGTIVTTKHRDGKSERAQAHGPDALPDVPIFCLVDGGTASAAELLTAALAQNRRATVVGETTFGKGTVQTFFDLPDGSAVKLTTARYYGPNGQSIDSKGIIPDIMVAGFAPDEIDMGDPAALPAKGAGAQSPLDVRLSQLSIDDPQLAEAIKAARKSFKNH